MRRVLYFCVGCRQVHNDDDYNESDGDLLIIDKVKFMESVAEHKAILSEEKAQ